MKQFKSLIPLKWYGPAGLISGKSIYPSPQSVLRESYDSDLATYHWTSEGPTTAHIRAAVVIAAHLPFTNLLTSSQYCLSARIDSEHRMLIVSVLNPFTWIDLAIEVGAEAWQVSNNNASTWTWNPPVLDEHSCKVRPLCINDVIQKKYQLIKPDTRRQLKEYDYEAVLTDLARGDLSHSAIGDKHSLSRLTVMKLAHRNGFKKAVKVKDVEN